MSFKFVSIGLLVLLLVTSFILVYNFILASQEFKRKRYINEFLTNMNDKYEERMKVKEAKLLYEGTTDDNKFIDRIDDLINKSSIRVIFPFLTSELLIGLSIVIASLTTYVFNKYYPYWLFDIAVFISSMLFLVLILRYMARRTYDKIDDQLLIYLNTLINLCGANDDIVVIFDKSTVYLKEPLKSFTEQFVFECRKGIPVHKAFKNFEDKIESKRFKQLLKNLSICSKHEANYKEILSKSKVILKHYFIEKERRKRAIYMGRMSIFSTFVVGMYLFSLIGSINTTMMDSLKTTILGNIIIGYNLLVVIIAIYKFITLDKLNY